MLAYSTRGMLFFGIPPYWFWAGLGFLLSIACYMILLYLNHYKVRDHIPMLGVGIVGLVIGAKLFGCITKVLVLIQTNTPITVEAISTAGIVFYGGLLGLLIFLLLAYHIRYGTIPWKVIDLLAICIPLFHAFARLGCFFGGCCYGLLSNSPFAILYETNQLDMAYRIPVQLYEVLGLLGILLLLICLHRNPKNQTHLLKKYFVAYAILRYFLEYLRGDSERWVWNNLSFSQIISILILGSILVYEYIRRKEHWKTYLED